MKKPLLANLFEVSNRIQYESQYWTGYDPNLINKLNEEVRRIELNYSDIYSELVEHRKRYKTSLSKFTIVMACITLFIGFCVYAGTHWRDAYKVAYNKIRAETEDIFVNDYEKLGFQKMVIGDSNYTRYEIYVRRRQ
jgi:hypothetical protein